VRAAVPCRPSVPTWKRWCADPVGVGGPGSRRPRVWPAPPGSPRCCARAACPRSSGDRRGASRPAVPRPQAGPRAPHRAAYAHYDVSRGRRGMGTAPVRAGREGRAGLEGAATTRQGRKCGCTCPRLRAHGDRLPSGSPCWSRARGVGSPACPFWTPFSGRAARADVVVFADAGNWRRGTSGAEHFAGGGEHELVGGVAHAAPRRGTAAMYGGPGPGRA